MTFRPATFFQWEAAEAVVTSSTMNELLYHRPFCGRNNVGRNLHDCKSLARGIPAH